MVLCEFAYIVIVHDDLLVGYGMFLNKLQSLATFLNIKEQCAFKFRSLRAVDTHFSLSAKVGKEHRMTAVTVKEGFIKMLPVTFYTAVIRHCRCNDVCLIRER